MKKVDFGYDTSMNPTGSFEGIGLNEYENDRAVGMTSGKLLGVLSRNGDNFLITKVCECFGSNTDLLGKISVRDAYVKVFPDSSNILFVDLVQSDKCEMLEEWLNSENERNEITSIDEIKRITKYYDKCPSEFYLAFQSEPVLATGINHEVFMERKNDPYEENFRRGM